ncbi:MAG: hypothetical protein RJQ21_14525 [Rhodospirillales bacterium]
MKQVVICLAATFLLSACVTDGPRDSGGRGMQISDAKEIEFARTDLDIPLYLHSEIASVTQEVRDNTSPIDSYNLGDHGKIQTQRAPHWFSSQTETDVKSREKFEERVKRLLGGRDIPAGSIEEVRHEDKLRALGYLVSFRRGSENCIYAYAGYRLGGRTPYDNDTGMIDSIIETLYCGPEEMLDQTRQMIGKVTKVKDRDRYAADLKKAGA